MRMQQLLLSLGFAMISPIVFGHGGVEIDQTPERLLQATLRDNPIPNTSMMVIQGPRPALMVKHRGSQPLHFLEQQAAWMVINEGGVFVDANSDKWQNLTNVQRQTAETVENPKNLALPEQGRWMQVQQQPQITWLEPTLAKANQDMTWSLPVSYQDQQLQIQGNFTWQKIAAVKQKSSGGSHGH